MKIELKKWTNEDKERLIFLCNAVDRRYLTGRIPYPYTEQTAEEWLAHIQAHDGIDCLYALLK